MEYCYQKLNSKFCVQLVVPVKLNEHYFNHVLDGDSGRQGGE